jgi:hypothetical protein
MIVVLRIFLSMNVLYHAASQSLMCSVYQEGVDNMFDRFAQFPYLDERFIKTPLHKAATDDLK